MMAPRSSPRRLLRAAVLAMKLIAGLVLLSPLAVIGGAEWMLSCCRVGAPRAPADAAVVLGGPMDPDGVAAWATRRRVAAGVHLLARGEVGAVIFSGGHAAPEETRVGPPPAEVMRELAIEMGAPPDRLLLEDRARSTMENLAFSAKIAHGRGFKNLILVSDSWHLPRVMAFAMWLGETDMHPAAVDQRPWMWTRDTPMLYLRETGAWWYGLARILRLVPAMPPAGD